jgi:hypothetical protein
MTTTRVNGANQTPADPTISMNDAETILQMANSKGSDAQMRSMLQGKGLNGARLQGALDALQQYQANDSGSGQVATQLQNRFKQIATGQNLGENNTPAWMTGANPQANAPTWNASGNTKDQVADYQRYFNNLAQNGKIQGAPALNPDGIVGDKTIAQARDAYRTGHIDGTTMKQFEQLYNKYPGSSKNQPLASDPKAHAAAQQANARDRERQSYDPPATSGAPNAGFLGRERQSYDTPSQDPATSSWFAALKSLI